MSESIQSYKVLEDYRTNFMSRVPASGKVKMEILVKGETRYDDKIDVREYDNIHDYQKYVMRTLHNHRHPHKINEIVIAISLCDNDGEWSEIFRDETRIYWPYFRRNEIL